MQDKIGDRMKRYESVTNNILVHRMPAIIRIDGRAFHTFTRGMLKPYDSTLEHYLQSTAERLMKEIQGAIFIYGQSDEISILVIDYKNLDSQPWLGGKIQKIVSISSSIATSAFAEAYQNPDAWVAFPTFDSRVFNIPEEDVANYFLWRAKDAKRNAILSTAHKILGHSRCQGKSTLELAKILEESHQWPGELPESFRNGWIISCNSCYSLDNPKDIYNECNKMIEKYMADGTTRNG